MSKKRISVEVYSRVVGFYQNVNHWNRGKQEEFKNRNELDAKDIERRLEKEYKTKIA